jgi:hypothetical protein
MLCIQPNEVVIQLFFQCSLHRISILWMTSANHAVCPAKSSSYPTNFALLVV